jgi:hypothetical protein
MASKIVGRTACPECGFESAHVKQSDKCLYRYCPECGSQHMARSARQVTDLMAKTRPVDGQAPAATASASVPSASAEASPAPAPAATATATAVATPPAAPPAPAKRRGLF